ncbi:hypothetical protein JI666_19510 [Bacillus sp. NTK071]|uniref:hypothetical protein n=1 Tax=Bacillus sp. NTK071 TaxID=2802175 RepID=UPI001A8F49FE|nr:hypothetical protein [Bacillus sp. NTK071]MBN8210940.1 hypothetical protein [Bacillus sp. NTK071]
MEVVVRYRQFPYEASVVYMGQRLLLTKQRLEKILQTDGPVVVIKEEVACEGTNAKGQ